MNKYILLLTLFFMPLSAKSVLDGALQAAAEGKPVSNLVLAFKEIKEEESLVKDRLLKLDERLLKIEEERQRMLWYLTGIIVLSSGITYMVFKK